MPNFKMDETEKWVHETVPSDAEIRSIRKRVLKMVEKRGGYLAIPKEWLKRIQAVITAEYEEGPRQPHQSPSQSSVNRRFKAARLLSEQLASDFVLMSMIEDPWWKIDKNSQAREICCQFILEIAASCISSVLLISRSLGPDIFAESLDAIDKLIDRCSDAVHEKHEEILGMIRNRYQERMKRDQIGETHEDA